MTEDGTGAGTSNNDTPTTQLTSLTPESTTTIPAETTTVATHKHIDGGRKDQTNGSNNTSQA